MPERNEGKPVECPVIYFCYAFGDNNAFETSTALKCTASYQCDSRGDYYILKSVTIKKCLVADFGDTLMKVKLCYVVHVHKGALTYCCESLVYVNSFNEISDIIPRTFLSNGEFNILKLRGQSTAFDTEIGHITLARNRKRAVVGEIP